MKPHLLLFTLFIINKGNGQSVNGPSNTLPSKEELTKIKIANIEKATKSSFQYFIIKAETNTYGYSIYADGHLYIHQTTIPSTPGNKGFPDTASAGKIARLVIQKIKQGEMPPTVTQSDLKKLNIIK